MRVRRRGRGRVDDCAHVLVEAMYLGGAGTLLPLLRQHEVCTRLVLSVCVCVCVCLGVCVC